MRSVDVDIQDIRESNHHNNSSNSTKFAEISNLKTDIKELEQENGALDIQTKELDKLIVRTQSEIKKGETEITALNEKIELAADKKARNEITVKQLEDEIESQLKNNDELKAKHDDLRGQAREKNVNIKEAEHQLSENKKRIVVLESRIKDKNRINERLNNEIAASQKEVEQQDVKGSQHNQKIDELENALK